LIWVDNLHVMGTPNYYVQKLYASNRGNEVVPMLNNNQPATGQDGLYASSTIDKATNELIIKIANVKKEVQSTEIIIRGVKKIGSTAKLTILQNNDLNAENSMDSPTVIAPAEKLITIKGKTITLELKGNSFSVIRVKI
jgi:alpha-L-arabinofuranosidase